MKFNVQYSTMLSVLPFDIIALIIDIVGENKDTKLLKYLTLVSHSFHQICSKYLFATIELYDTRHHIQSSKKGFIKLLKSRPDVVKYIRKLTYKVGYTYERGYVSRSRSFLFPPTHSSNSEDDLLSPILPNLL